MALDELIIENQVLETISSQRKKTNLLDYVLKEFQNVTIVGEIKNNSFLTEYHVKNQNKEFNMIKDFSLTDRYIEEKLTPENTYIIISSELLKLEADEIGVKNSYKNYNVLDLIKELKKITNN